MPSPLLILAAAFAVSCRSAATDGATEPSGVAVEAAAAGKQAPAERSKGERDASAVAVFAGGCFWCMEPPFEKLDGVRSVTSGYTGGSLKSPSYSQVSSGRTGHVEAVEILYDPKRVSYSELLDVFWKNIDPTRDDGQFCDKGPQYRSAIFVRDARQKRLALESKRKVERELGRKIATEVLDAGEFFRAEEYHQDYYKKNPLRYRYYRFSCGRDQRLEEVWGQDP